jgi:hypothetical protein
MRRIIVTIATLVPLALATPALADSVRVNAAENMTTSGSRGSCQVHRTVADQVLAFCLSDGRTWFKVRVEGVDGTITKVRTADSGDCSGQTLRWTQRTATLVKITNVGRFRCTYTSVVVRFQP